MNLLKNTGDIWLPPPDLTISEWADEYRRIPPEASAEPGRWHTDRAPYQRGMLDAICTSERVVMMTAAQIGKTEMLLNVLGYFMDKEPSPVLLLYPTLEMGESFSKDRLVPMIRDTPCLSAQFDIKARVSDNNILYKRFANGGAITIAGSNSPASLASRPIRVLLCDEVDHYKASAGEEGDPLSLAMKRTQNFWNRKIIQVSTPTLIQTSKILKIYQLSTQEEWEVPCPVCGEYTPFLWELIRYKDLTEPLMECPHCHKSSNERKWKSSQRFGRWTAKNESEKVRGFHMNAFASPWAAWPDLITQYEEAYKGGDETLKVWYNTVLGLPYENVSGVISAEETSSRAEDYGCEIPEGVLVLTCGVDVQDDRLELEVVGWGQYKESWGIEYRVIYGSTASNDVWDELDAYLSRTWRYEDGEEIGISCTCIDSAGHCTEEVYRFVRGKSRRNIYAIVGRGRFGMSCVSKPSRNNRGRVPLFTLGVSTIKGMLFSRLSAEGGRPGYCHFPKGRGYDEIYYKGLLSERQVIKRKNGQEYITWEQRDQKIRNEPLDCRVYATGAIELINPDMKARARKRGLKKSGAKKAVKKVKGTKGGLLKAGISL